MGDTEQFEEEPEEVSSGGSMDFGEPGINQLAEKLREHTDTSPILSGGDVDAAWEETAIGEELVGGSNPTPDQDEVDEIGRAMGVTFEDNEPLNFIEKLEKRDRNRWELDPASSEDFGQ